MKIRFLEDLKLKGDILVLAGETCEEIQARTGAVITEEDKAAFVQYRVAEVVTPPPAPRTSNPIKEVTE